MEGNDLGNQGPRRVLVHTSAVFDSTPSLRRVLGLFKVASTTHEPSIAAVSYFSRWAEKGLVFAMYSYSGDSLDAGDGEAALRAFSHPFTSFLEFEDPSSVSTYIAHQRDVVAVVDPRNPGRFGSRSAWID